MESVSIAYFPSSLENPTRADTTISKSKKRIARAAITSRKGGCSKESVLVFGIKLCDLMWGQTKTRALLVGRTRIEKNKQSYTLSLHRAARIILKDNWS
jgi:hypothetical protein